MWYYSENNQQLGPVSEDDLKQKARSGGLKPTTLVWKDGMSDWKPIADLPELAISMQNHSAPVATSTVPGPPAAIVNPYASPQSGTVQSPAMQMSSPAPYINSGGILAFAIVSTIMCCPPFGIPGIVYAAKINGQLAAGHKNQLVNRKCGAGSASAAGCCFSSFTYLLSFLALQLG